MSIRYISISLLLFTLSMNSYAEVNCPETIYEYGHNKKYPIIESEEFTEREKPIFSGGKIRCHISTSIKNPRSNILFRTETGLFNGIEYNLYYNSGDITLQGNKNSRIEKIDDLYKNYWLIKCKKDKIDDIQRCSIHKEGLAIWSHTQGSYSVSIGSNHYPGSKIFIRVDNNQPISADEENGFQKTQSNIIISQLQKGNKALSRYEEWPYTSYIDKEIELFGFSQAIELLNIIREIKK